MRGKQATDPTNNTFHVLSRIAVLASSIPALESHQKLRLSANLHIVEHLEAGQASS